MMTFISKPTYQLTFAIGTYLQRSILTTTTSKTQKIRRYSLFPVTSIYYPASFWVSDHLSDNKSTRTVGIPISRTLNLSHWYTSSTLLNHTILDSGTFYLHVKRNFRDRHGHNAVDIDIFGFRVLPSDTGNMHFCSVVGCGELCFPFPGPDYRSWDLFGPAEAREKPPSI